MRFTPAACFPVLLDCQSFRVYLVGGGLLGHSRRTLTEAVLELALHRLQVTHTARAGSTTTQSLLAPVVCTIRKISKSRDH